MNRRRCLTTPKPQRPSIVVTSFGREVIGGLKLQHAGENKSVRERKASSLSRHSSDDAQRPESEGIFTKKKNSETNRFVVKSKTMNSQSEVDINQTLLPINFTKREVIPSRLIKGFFLKRDRLNKVSFEETQKLAKFSEKLQEASELIDGYIMKKQLQSIRLQSALKLRKREKFDDLSSSVISPLQHRRTSVYKSLFNPNARWCHSVDRVNYKC
jgi:hypothetical protein